MGRLSQLELEKEFANWAYEALEEEKIKDNHTTKDSHEALQTALDGVSKRIDNLLALKISPENSDGNLLSDEEFANRKRALLIEKEKLNLQLSKTNPNKIEWAEIAKDSFNFALQAKEWFKAGGSENKKVIFKTVGSNPILLDQKLDFQLRYLFFKYKEGIEKTKDEIKRLEPKDKLSEQANLKYFLKSSIWC